MSVRIKPLVWRCIGDRDIVATTEVGVHYAVIEYRGMAAPFKLDVRNAWTEQSGRMFQALDDAKAAAQADFETRILAYIEQVQA